MCLHTCWAYCTVDAINNIACQPLCKAPHHSDLITPPWHCAITFAPQMWTIQAGHNFLCSASNRSEKKTPHSNRRVGHATCEIFQEKDQGNEVVFFTKKCFSPHMMLFLGRSPTSSNAKDYFTGYAHFHGNSIIFWIKADGYNRKGSCDSIHLRKTLALFRMQSWLFATRSYEIRYGGHFRQPLHAKAEYELFFILSPRWPILTLLRKS